MDELDLILAINAKRKSPCPQEDCFRGFKLIRTFYFFFFKI